MTPAAVRAFKAVARSISLRLMERLEWLTRNADMVIHHALTSMPDDLKGLCRLRMGDWRILYWVYHDLRRLVVYGVSHRREIYGKLR